MSLDATQWAWKIQAISASDKLVLLSMADRAGENHTCWPCLERLSKDTCLNIKTVKAAIKRLKDSGYIRDTNKRVGYKNHTIVYELVGVNGRECDVIKPEIGSYSKEPKNGSDQNLRDPNLDLKRPKIGQSKRPKIGPQNLPPLESTIEPNPPIPPRGDMPSPVQVSDAEIVINRLNEISGKKFRPSKASLKNTNARLKENYSVDELILVAEHKTLLWSKDPRMREYLRPQTLFSENFESYLQAANEWDENGRPEHENHTGAHRETSFERSQRTARELEARLLREIAELEAEEANGGDYYADLAAHG